MSLRLSRANSIARSRKSSSSSLVNPMSVSTRIKDYWCTLRQQRLLAHAVDFVAQARGFLEFQILRVLVHPGFQFLDERSGGVGIQHRVIRRLLRELAQGLCQPLARTTRARARRWFLARAFHDVGDVADDGPGGNAVLEVVLHLL